MDAPYVIPINNIFIKLTFHALFGVSTKSGGKIPFQNENMPSVWYIVFMQLAMEV